MSGALALAASIAAMDRTGLERLVASRRVLTPASVHEPLGLAIELLRPDSITRALQTTHRDELEALAALSAQGPQEHSDLLDALAARGLVGLDPATDRVVPLAELREQLPALPELLKRPTAERPLAMRTAPANTTVWYGPALTAVRRAAQVLRTSATRPVRLGRKGHPVLTSVRDLADAAHCEIEPIDRLLDVLRAAELLAPFRDHSGGDYLGLSPAGRQWLALDYPHRWLALATAAIDGFDERLRHAVEQTGGDLTAAVARIPIDFPLLPEGDREALGRVSQCAEDLGLTVAGWLAPATQALLARRSSTSDDAELGVTATAASPELAEALAIAERDIPAPAPGVYLQPDLSLIVPGPLLPDDEAALSTIAETEQLGPAASLRLTSGSLTRAVRGGHTPGEIRELLQRLSLTGIPQPLDYLLGDLERKLAEPPASEPDPWPVGFRAAGVAAGGGSDAGVAGSGAGPKSWAKSENDESAKMIERLLTAAQEAGGEGDLTRRLKLAIRDRSTVQVTAVAGRDERVFTLLPMSLQGGRLRATDQSAGVERTLPVSAITAVEAA